VQGLGAPKAEGGACREKAGRFPPAGVGPVACCFRSAAGSGRAGPLSPGCITSGSGRQAPNHHWQYMGQEVGVTASEHRARFGGSLLAYNLGNLRRKLVLPRRIDNWQLTSLQRWLVKTGGPLVKHAQYYVRYYSLHSPGLDGRIGV
jgi:hypothetical protein